MLGGSIHILLDTWQEGKRHIPKQQYFHIAALSLRRHPFSGYQQQCPRCHGIIGGFSGPSDSNDPSQPESRNSLWSSNANTHIRHGKTDQSDIAGTRRRRSPPPSQFLWRKKHRTCRVSFEAFPLSQVGLRPGSHGSRSRFSRRFDAGHVYAMQHRTTRSRHEQKHME